MSTDFAPVFEKKFHSKVVPGLLMVLDDNANPRVQVSKYIFITRAMAPMAPIKYSVYYKRQFDQNHNYHECQVELS